MICIGGVCVPYSAVIPLFLLGIKWVLSKLHTYGLLPNFRKKVSSTESNDSNSSSAGTSSSLAVKRLESEEEFDDLLKKDAKLVVKFTAAWCQPCKKIHPFYAKQCEEHPDYDFITVDVDDFDGIAGKYSVAMMPTFIVVRGESVLGTCRGSSEPELESFLKEHL
eukprot:jgi/Psemu1/257124/estExt_Genewise1Plus.C_2100063